MSDFLPNLWRDVATESEQFSCVLKQLKQHPLYQSGEFSDALRRTLNLGAKVFSPQSSITECLWANYATLLSKRGDSLPELNSLSAACVVVVGKFYGQRISLERLSRYMAVPISVIRYIADCVPLMLDFQLNQPTVCNYQYILLEPFLTPDTEHLMASVNKLSSTYYLDDSIFENGLLWCAYQSIVQTLESQSQADLKHRFLNALLEHPLQAISSLSLN